MDTVIIVAVLVLVSIFIVRHYWRAIRGKAPGCSCQNQDDAAKSCCQSNNCSESKSTENDSNCRC